MGVNLLSDLSREIREAYWEDLRSKAIMRPKPRSISRIRPRRVVFPSDRKKNEDQNGPVVVRPMTAEERMMMDMNQLPIWKDFLRLDLEEQKKLLEPLIGRYTDRDIAEKMGADPKHVTYVRHKLGLKKYHLNNTRQAVGRSSTVEKSGNDKPVNSTRMELVLSGQFTTQELRQRLESLALILPDSGDGKLTADLKITEPSGE